MTFDQRMRREALESLGLGITRRSGRFTLALRAPIFFLDAGIDLFAMHLYFGRSLDAELDLARPHLKHGDLHRITDPNVFA